MKRILSAIALFFLLTVPAFSLSDTEYLRMMKNNADFARANRKLSQVWTQMRKTLPKSVFSQLQNLQRQWIKSGRDDEAAELMDEGYSRVEAYTIATNNRTEALPEIASDLREELNSRKNTARPRPQTRPAPSRPTTERKRPATPEPEEEPEEEPETEPSEPGFPLDSVSLSSIEGEYQSNNGFMMVKISDSSTEEVEVTVSRYKDEVHWTAKGWLEGNTLELSDNNYSECQATLTFSAKQVKVDITNTDDWNEAIAPDFILAGTYKKLGN